MRMHFSLSMHKVLALMASSCSSRDLVITSSCSVSCVSRSLSLSVCRVSSIVKTSFTSLRWGGEKPQLTLLSASDGHSTAVLSPGEEDRWTRTSGRVTQAVKARRQPMGQKAGSDNNLTMGLPPGPAIPLLLLQPELKTGVHTKCPQQRCPPWPRRGKDQRWRSHTVKLFSVIEATVHLCFCL